ncbi:MAG: glycosyltransferase [Anaerolineae bacterium]|nr:glycosyltransferase [Anaerolineae bacterium]
MSTALISIVLPVYNGARYLRQSIQSVLRQTHQKWELLVVDDCSTDSTPEIIAEYCSLDQRIRSFRHDKNRRLPGALNTGFIAAQGEYMTWTSDDNLYQPTALQEMADYLDAHPEIAFVYTDFDLIDENGMLIETVLAGDWKDLGFVDVIGGCFLYRRIIHEKIGYYDENAFLAEDLEFELRAMVNGFQFAPLHKNLYQYRDHPGALTSTKARQIYRAHAEINQRYFPKMPWMSKETKARAYLHLARKALAIRDFTATLRFILSGVSCSPLFTIGYALQYPFRNRSSTDSSSSP